MTSAVLCRGLTCYRYVSSYVSGSLQYEHSGGSGETRAMHVKIGM